MRENGVKNGNSVTLLLYKCLRAFLNGNLVTIKW